MSMIWLFVNWSFSSVGLRTISRSSQNLFPKIFSENLSARILLALIAVFIGLVAIALSPVLSKNIWSGCLGVALGIVSAFNLGWYFTGTNRPKLAVKFEVLGFLISIFLILILVKSKNDAAIVLLSLFISGIICSFSAYWCVKGEVSLKKIDLKSGYLLIKSSSSIFLYSSLTGVVGVSSTYLLGILSSQTEVGYFGAAERLVSLGLSLMGPAGMIFLPRITKLFANNHEAAYSMVRKSFILIFSIGCSGCLISIILGKWIIDFVFGPGFDASAKILTIYSITFPVSAINLIVGSYILFPLNEERIMIKVGLFSLIIYILFFIPLGYFYGGVGMAIAKIISDIFLLLSLLFACRHLKLIKNIFMKKDFT